MNRITNESQLSLLWDHVTKLAQEIAVEYRILPGEFWSRGKDRRLVDARKELGFRLRDTLGYTTRHNPGATEPRYRFYVFHGPESMRCFRAKPVSYPMIGKLLGMDHSTFVLHKTKLRNAERDRIYGHGEAI